MRSHATVASAGRRLIRRRDRSRDRRTTLAAVASVLLHLLVFGYLARIAPVLRTPIYAPQPDVQLDLAPSPETPAAVAFSAPRRTRASAERGSPAILPPRARQDRRTLSRAPRVLDRRPPPPDRAMATRAHAAGAPATASSAGSGSPGSPAAGDVAAKQDIDGADQGAGDGVRAVLRATVGCSHEDFANLTAKERAACAQRMGRDARAVQDASVDPLSSRDRAYLNALRAADQAARTRRTPAYGCRLGGKADQAGDCALQGSAVGAQGLSATPP